MCSLTVTAKNRFAFFEPKMPLGNKYSKVANNYFFFINISISLSDRVDDIPVHHLPIRTASTIECQPVYLGSARNVVAGKNGEDDVIESGRARVGMLELQSDCSCCNCLPHSTTTDRRAV